ncbi:MAG: carotenoid biosynthesis protein [Bacteroidetes bacterium]|nr:carotenoid biosynthesis protein [Bacteroidota bacterium]
MIDYLKTRPYILVTLLLIVFYAVGLAGLFYNPTKHIIIFLIPYTILMNFILMMFFHKGWSRTFILISAITAIAGFLVEAIGVSTGIIFGEYSYGSRMGLKIFHTPLLIGINWVFVVYTAFMITRNFQRSWLIKALTGALLLVLYDLLLEPFAMSYDMWDWKGGVVPVQNYLAWFILSFVFLTMFIKSGIDIRNKIAIPIVLIQSSFFLVLFISGY